MTTNSKKAFKRSYNPRSDVNPSSDADSTGKWQEDGKESLSGHIGEES